MTVKWLVPAPIRTNYPQTPVSRARIISDQRPVYSCGNQHWFEVACSGIVVGWCINSMSFDPASPAWGPQCPTLFRWHPNHRPPIQHRGHCGLSSRSAAHCFGPSRRQQLRHPEEAQQLLALTSRLVTKNGPRPPTMLSSLQNPRQAAAQLMNFGLILSTAFMVRYCACLPIPHCRHRSSSCPAC
jgi:hypothetical protein